MTLVSNMIIADFSVEARWLSHGLPRWDVKFHTTEWFEQLVDRRPKILCLARFSGQRCA